MARRVHRAESSLWLALIAAAIWVPLLDGAVLPVDQQEALNQGSATSGLPTNLAMQAFFDQLDNNRDGQLQQQELHAAAVSLGSADATAAATAMIHKLDSVDSGLDVSMTELDEHLHQVLKVGCTLQPSGRQDPDVNCASTKHSLSAALGISKFRTSLCQIDNATCFFACFMFFVFVYSSQLWLPVVIVE